VLSTVLNNIGPAAAADYLIRSGGQTLQWFVGGEYLGAQDAANRIVFVPAGLEKWDGPRKQSPPPGSGAPAPGYPRSLRTRFVRIESHIWGPPPVSADPTGAHYFDSVDNMIESLVVGIHQNVEGEYHVLGGEFPKALQQSGMTQYGRVYVLHWEYEMPSRDAAVTTAIIQTIAQTNTISPTLPAPGTPGS